MSLLSLLTGTDCKMFGNFDFGEAEIVLATMTLNGSQRSKSMVLILKYTMSSLDSFSQLPGWRAG